MKPKGVRLLLLALCVLSTSPLGGSAIGENNLLIQVQDGVVYHSADGGQNWIRGVPDGAQIGIVMPQQSQTAPIMAQIPTVTVSVQPAPGLPQAGATFFFANAQGAYAVMPAQTGCSCCLGAASTATAATIPGAAIGAQSESSPAQDFVPNDLAADPTAVARSAASPVATEPQGFIAPAPTPPEQGAPPNAAQESVVDIRMDGSAEFEPTPGAQILPAQQPRQFVTVEPSQAIPLQPAQNALEQSVPALSVAEQSVPALNVAEQSVPEQSAPEQGAPEQGVADREAKQEATADQTGVLLGTAANGQSVWVWHDIGGKSIYSTDNGMSWSSNEPEGLIIAGAGQ